MLKYQGLLLLVPPQMLFMRLATQLRVDIVRWTDARVKLMNEILQGIKLYSAYVLNI